MERRIVRLEGAVRRYAWGSRTVLAELQGRPSPTAEPEAELWFGAHPVAPATVVSGPRPGSLDALIAADPAGTLGADVARRFDARLPFLLKVLAVEEPLSLQAHPDEDDARHGFATEEARGPARDHPGRVYRDAWPKPELLYALTPVHALCGFRQPARVLDLLDALDVRALDPVRAAVAERGAGAYPDLVRRLLTSPDPERAGLVADIAAGARRLADGGGSHAAIAGWLVRLAQGYPCDPGVAVATLLDLVELEPGDALHLPPGELHAYLRGTGVEVMASSDNVLRGGLTPKHVDVEGLLQVLRTTPGGPVHVRARTQDQRSVLPTPTPHFELSRLDLDAPEGTTGPGAGLLAPGGPAILLVVSGEVTVQTTAVPDVTGQDGEGGETLGPGQAVFVTARTEVVTLRGRGQVFRAGVGEPAGVGTPAPAATPASGAPPPDDGGR